MKKTIHFIFLLGCLLYGGTFLAQLPSFTLTPQLQCYSPGSNSATAYVTLPVPGATSYSWTVSGPCAGSVTTFSNGAVAFINFPCCGIFTVSAAGYFGNVFVDMMPPRVATVNCNNGSVTAVASSTAICNGSSAIITAFGGNSYTWSTGSTSNSIIVSPTVTTCYTVSGYNSSGCFGTAVRCINVVSGPTLAVPANTTVCAGQVMVLTTSGANSYTWVTSQGTYTGQTVVFTPSASSCYTVYGSNALGCTSSAVGCITLLPPASSPVINGNFIICAGQTAVLTTSSAANYTWFPGGSNSPSIVVTPTVTTCYTLAAANCTGGITSSIRCVTVTQSAPNPVISGNFSVCAGQTGMLSASGASSYTWLPGGNVGPTLLVTPSVTTCYTVVGANTCGTGFAVRCLTVNPSPTVSVNGNLSVCSGQSTTLTAAGSASNTYFWYTSQGTFSGTTIVLTPTANGCFTLTAINPQGCIAHAVRCITVSPGTNPVINGNLNICQGQSVTLSASSTVSYTWFPGGVTNNNITVTPSTTTCYTLVGYNICGFLSSTVRCVTVSPGGNPVINGNFNICQGQSTVLFASGASTYTWYPGGITNTSIAVSPSVTTCYTLAGYNSCGGIQYAVRCVTVGNSPNIVTTPNFTTVCPGQSVVIVASGANSYTWTTSQGTFTGAVVVLTPTTLTCYSVTGSSGPGCNSTAGGCIGVSQGTLGNLMMSGNLTTCQGNATTLFASGAQSFTWFPGNIISSSISVSPSVTTCYTVIGNTSCAGIQSAVGCVTVGVSPIISVTGNLSGCSGQSTTLTASGTIFNTYTWTTSQGTFTGTTIVLTPTANGCFTVSGSNGPGCYGSTVRCFTISQGSTPVISGNFNVCQGQSTTLFASGASSYTWLPSGAVSSSIVVTPPVTTCYTLVGYSPCGGLNSTVRCVTVSPTPSISVIGNLSICSGQSTTLTAGGSPSNAYIWYTSQGTFSGSTIVLTPTSTSCFTLAGTTTLGCTVYAVRCVTVSPGSNPVIISSGGFNICAGQPINLFASGAVSYTWFPGGTVSSSITISPSVTTCYTLVGYSPCAGLNTAVRCVTVGSSAPTMSVTGNTPICAGQSVTLTAFGASSYTWFTNNGTYTGSIVVLTPSATTCFNLAGTTGNSCTGNLNVCIVVSPGSNPVISGNFNVCQGQSTTLFASGATSYTWFPGGSTAPFIVVTPSTTTCYTLVGYSSCAGLNSAVKCVTVGGISPVLSISGNTTICAGQSTTLTASGAGSYTWFAGSGNFTTTSIVLTPSISTCFTLAGSNSPGCIGYAVGCINVSPGGNPVISGNLNTCQGQSTALFASGASSYTWLPSGTVSSSIVVTPSVTTCYTLVGYSPCGGLNSTVRCVTVSNTNTIGVSGQTVLCSGATTTLTATGAQSYTWLPGGFTGPSIVVTPTASICYTVLGYSQNGCGIGSRVVCVSVNPKPIIFTSGGLFCTGQAGTLGATGATNYTWQPFNLTGSSIVITPTTSGCYTITGMNTFGCTNTAVGCYSVVPCCSVTISGSGLICAGSPNVLTASGAQNYTWLPSNTTGATLTVSPLSSTCYTVLATGPGCNTSAVKCVSVVTGPSITVNGNSAVCAGSGVILSANGASTYTWLPGNLTGSAVIVSPSVSTCYTVVGTNFGGCVGLGYKCVQVTPKPIITTSGGFLCAGSTGQLAASGATSYTWLPYGLTGSVITVTASANNCYTVTGSNGFGCTSSVAACYSIAPSPTITITGNSSVCAGGSTTLVASGATSYTWMPGSTSGPGIVITPTATTCYTVSGVNNFGCRSTAVKCVNVQQGAFISVAGANIICAGTSANLLASGALTYTWSNGSNSPFITVAPAASSCYTVTGTTAGGCIGSAVKCISVQASPSVAISGPASICSGSGALLIASGASSYVWNTGSTSGSISVSPSVTTVYTVTGSNGSCSATKTFTLIVNPKPLVAIFTSSLNNPVICAGTSVQLMGSGAFSYTWSTGATSTNVVVSPTVTTTYTLTGSLGGCSSSAVKTISVSACTGISNYASSKGQVAVYPNPSSGLVTLQGDGYSEISYGVYDMLGRELIKGRFTETQEVDLSEYSNGTYFIRFESGSVSSYKKLILEK